MKSALSDTLVICDMDNTLLTAKEGLPACNRTVINLFTSLGGRGYRPPAGVDPRSVGRHTPFAAGHLLQRRAAV